MTENTKTPVEPKVEEKVEEKVYQLTETELQNLLNSKKQEVERDIKIGDWEEVENINNENKTAHLKMYQKDSDSPLGLIIDWKFLKNEYDENSRMYDNPIYKLIVLYDDGKEKEVKIPLLDFAHINNFETVEIVDTVEKRMVKVHGQVQRTAKSRDGYTMSTNLGGTANGGDLVNLEEVKIETIVTVKRPNGKTLKINANRLNS